MAFDAKRSSRGTQSAYQKRPDGFSPTKVGKEDDDDSLVSTHSVSRLQKKANLELIWQKANSINGIRKMNMQFKQERRNLTALDANENITQDYWQVCE